MEHIRQTKRKKKVCEPNIALCSLRTEVVHHSAGCPIASTQHNSTHTHIPIAISFTRIIPNEKNHRNDRLFIVRVHVLCPCCRLAVFPMVFEPLSARFWSAAILSLFCVFCLCLCMCVCRVCVCARGFVWSLSSSLISHRFMGATRIFTINRYHNSNKYKIRTIRRIQLVYVYCMCTRTVQTCQVGDGVCVFVCAFVPNYDQSKYKMI